MAHNLNYNERTGKYSFFSVQKKPWHNLGQVVDQYPTSAEAIQFAGLDYQVIKAPLFTPGKEITIDSSGEIKEGGNIMLPDNFATMRSDTNRIFGIVGKDYQIVQNADAFTFFDAIVGGGDGILYETAGSLGQGEKVFITAKLPDYIRVGNGDDVTEKYIFLTTSHDGTGSITAAFTPVRIVCQNTLNAALSNKSNTIRIRHTSGARQRLENAHRVMGITNRMSAQLEEIFNQWTRVRITDKEVRKLIQRAFCSNKETLDALRKGADDELSTVFRNTVEDAFTYGMMADSQQIETTKGTVFGAYNAVTGYFQNVRRYRDDGAKLQSIVMGGAAQVKCQRAFELCRQFAKDGTAILNLN